MLNKPKKTEFSVYHNIKKPSKFNINSNFLSLSYGLIAKENNIITAAQLAAATLSIKRKIKQNIKLIIRVFPHLPVTKRPPEQPLGKGKSNISYWATTIKTGTLIFELKTNDSITTKNALIAASYKFPFKTQIVNKFA